MLATFMAVAAPAATGALLVSRLRLSAGGWPQTTLAAAAATFVGFALHSLWTLVWLTATGSIGSRWTFTLFDLLLPITIAIAGRVMPGAVPANDTSDAPRSVSGRFWLTSAVLLVALAATTTAISAMAQDDGGWDGRAIWNFKARWIVLAGPDWSAFLTNGIFLSAHPDYPLLLPLVVARIWGIAGHTMPVVPQAVGAATVGLIYVVMFAAAWMSRGPMTAAVACGVLMALQQLQIVAASQYADVPLSLAFFVCCVSVAMGVRQGGASGWFLLAGLAGGAAMWTKNEGTVFVGCVAASTAVVAAVNRTRPGVIARRLFWIAAGVLPFLPAALFVKSMAPVNKIVSSQTGDVLRTHLFDPARHLAIVDYTVRMIGSLMDPVVLVLFVAFVLLAGRARDFAPAGHVLLIVALTAAGYYAVFLVTPYPQDWHLRTAADRLLIQLWPSIVFGAMLASGRSATRATSL